MLHTPLTNYHLAADLKSHQKVYLKQKQTKNIEEFSGKKSGKWAHRQKKEKTERAIGVGRKTREEILKWNQMTVLRFQTGGRQQTFSASLKGGSMLMVTILAHDPATLTVFTETHHRRNNDHNNTSRLLYPCDTHGALQYNPPKHSNPYQTSKMMTRIHGWDQARV